MADNKKLVSEITDINEDFARWYTDVVTKADLIGYTNVKGCMAIKPYGYAIWENIMKTLDSMFKKTGVQNVSMPMFIPKSLLQKEKDHVEGFAPEVAWVTMGGSENLQEPLCVRPTSETLFCDFYAKDINSYRDLPRLYNQWCTVVRWEKTTRPFLRSREFHWQEGHTAHANEADAKERTLQMLDVYSTFCEEVLAIPVIKGIKSDKEKFAGAVSTYTIEAMMHDGQALQSATSHYFGDGFAKAFDIKYLSKENKLEYVHQTSWGISTRIIGAIIMTHGDNYGLLLPPKIAPVQMRIIPIRYEKDEVKNAISKIKDLLPENLRYDIDESDKSPGYKYSEQEMRGIPLRLEIGPRDAENNKCVLVRRDNKGKIEVDIDEVGVKIPEILDIIQSSMYEKALEHRNNNMREAKDYEEFKKIISTQKGFVKTFWCKDRACEDKIKEDTGATSRCMPLGLDDTEEGTCICCGKKTNTRMIWGRAY